MILLSGGDDTKRIALHSVKDSLVQLANRGDTEAQNLLGAIALEVERDGAEAYGWFSRSSAAGDHVGQRSLGYLYATGTGVAADEEKAVELYRLAAEGGDYYAMHNLATMNLHGDGELCTFAETLRLLTAAADFGIPEAAAELGDALAGANRSEEAVAWYRKASLGGHTGAMNVLGSWFRDGVVGEPDLVEALHWFLAMLNYGDGDGMHEAIQLVPLMSKAQVREGARRAGREGDGEALLIDLD